MTPPRIAPTAFQCRHVADSGKWKASEFEGHSKQHKKLCAVEKDYDYAQLHNLQGFLLFFGVAWFLFEKMICLWCKSGCGQVDLLEI